MDPRVLEDYVMAVLMSLFLGAMLAPMAMHRFRLWRQAQAGRKPGRRSLSH